MLRALVASAGRFPNIAPHGYETGEIRWVLEIQPGGDCSLVRYGKGELKKELPTRGDRSGTVSEDNLKPALLVDRASYALGLREDGKLDPTCLEHRRGFRALIEGLEKEWPDSDPSAVLEALEHIGGGSGMAAQRLRARIEEEVRPGDMVAFRVAPAFPFESALAKSFWRRTLESECCRGDGYCCCCGARGPILRILPFQVSFAGYSCPISSFNEPAFRSFGREQTANSPLCFDCASRGTRVLQHLLGSERHCRVLTRDESLGEGKSPLRNQWAVFWLKEQPVAENGELIDVEALLREPLGSIAPVSQEPPADPDQMRRLYGIPFSPSAPALNLDQNRFYVAVLSPNKSRLVLREWIDESAALVVGRLAAYDAARTIETDDGSGVWRPDIPGMLAALKPPKSRGAVVDANLVRSLLRTAYRAAGPPFELLEQAALRFRVPDRARNRAEEEELRKRRQTLAAAIKFVITYGTQEAIRMQTVDLASVSGPYLCGRLLAILEEAQLRASRWRVQARLVDRYYGGASSSPSSVLGLLLSRCTSDHMPKVRKLGAGYRDLERDLERVVTAIDEAGGFPRALALREQGRFALGFYHQRARFAAARPRTDAGTPAGADREERVK